jgi:hypothetical protein
MKTQQNTEANRIKAIEELLVASTRADMWQIHQMLRRRSLWPENNSVADLLCDHPGIFRLDWNGDWMLARV